MKIFISHLFVFVVGIGVCLGFQYLSVDQHGDSIEMDRNSDGMPDEIFYYLNGRFLRIETDRNFDGNIDAITYYGDDDYATHSKYDDNFNGEYESFIIYELGQPKEFQGDLDGDGEIDHIGAYKNGVLELMSIRLHAISRVVRKDHYKLGKIIHSEIDTDLDGYLDTTEYYNFYGRIIDTHQ